MLATKFFPETFRNFQKLIARNQLIEDQVLNKTRNPFILDHISSLYAITNLISLQLSQLQSNPIINLIQSYNLVERKIDSPICSRINTQIKYEEEKNFFLLKYWFDLIKQRPLLQSISEVKQFHQKLMNMPADQNPLIQTEILTVEIKIANCQQQQFDHPSVRETLYFHELKDIDQYVKYEFLPKTPLFIQAINRKKLEVKCLDSKNPYGFPLKAPPLIFQVQIDGKIYFKVKSTYHETNVIQIGSLRKVVQGNSFKVQKRFKISGMNVPSKIQQIIYQDLLVSILRFDDQEILKLHKLAYLGGRVKKLNLMMDMHEAMTIQNEDLFDQLIKAT